MTSLFSKPQMPGAPPPVPTVDDAAAQQNASDRSLRRGRVTTMLTGEGGLPDLGSTRTPNAGGM